jgi:protein phosphatase
MNSMLQEVSLYFKFFLDSVSKNLNQISKRSTKLILPHFPASFLLSFLEESKILLENEPTLLELDGSFVIVGDIHGHILDLFRIFKKFQYPYEFKYLFLGDLVDRGEFSFETIIFILLLKYQFPNSVYIILGNHEFAHLMDFYQRLNHYVPKTIFLKHSLIFLIICL